jgi:membrane protease YdiL (CAAX protease family)
VNRVLLRWPITAVFLAIAITSTMDATGFTLFSALPLCALTAGLWFIQRMSRAEIGLRFGRPRAYGVALLHPLLVIGALTIIAVFAGVGHVDHVQWKRVGTRVLVSALVGPIMGLLTEEGFFRGALWASLRRAGLADVAVLLWTSVAFALWHISAVVLNTGFNPPPSQVPLFLVNAFVMGMIWGWMRAISGSIVVSSFCHSIWNAVAYSLYGFGAKVGALGVRDTSLYAPEVGILGLVLNVVFLAILFGWWRGNRRMAERVGFEPTVRF